MAGPLATLGLAACLALASCASGGARPATPYTADEIRAECRPGTRITLRLTPPGGEEGVQVMEFLDEVDGRASFRSFARATGAADAPVARVAWEELRDHAAFPPEATERTRERCSVPAGDFDCWHYAVRGEGDRVTHFWFALDKPGPPVRMRTVVGGRTVQEMELLAYERGA